MKRLLYFDGRPDTGPPVLLARLLVRERGSGCQGEVGWPRGCRATASTTTEVGVFPPIHPRLRELPIAKYRVIVFSGWPDPRASAWRLLVRNNREVGGLLSMPRLQVVSSTSPSSRGSTGSVRGLGGKARRRRAVSSAVMFAGGGGTTGARDMDNPPVNRPSCLRGSARPRSCRITRGVRLRPPQ